jgi:hypothetical protein
MPVSWRIAGDIVWLESVEPLTFAEWRAAIDAALADKAYRPEMGILHDQRRLKHGPSVEEGAARVAFVASRGVRKWASLAESGDSYGMARMGEALSDGTATAIRAFRDPAEAEAWLRDGLPRR